jgi:hypothetical protein
MSTQLPGGAPLKGPGEDDTDALGNLAGQRTGQAPFQSNVSSPEDQETASLESP